MWNKKIYKLGKEDAKCQTRTKHKVNYWRNSFLMAPKNGGESLAAEEIAKADAFCEGYKSFLKARKTERKQ